MTVSASIIAADRLLDLHEVKAIAGLGKTMIYRKVREGSFPKPLKPGGVSTRWSEREVQAWLEDLKGARDAGLRGEGS